jgi:hypothetical protein
LRESEPAAPPRVAGFSPERRVTAPRSMGRLRRVRQVWDTCFWNGKPSPSLFHAGVAVLTGVLARHASPRSIPPLSRNDPARLALQESHDRP